MGCAEIFGHRQMGERATKLYFQAVGCGDADRVAAALRHVLRHGDHFPTPRELRIELGIEARSEPSHA